MGRKSKKYLSCFLSALMLFMACLGTSALTGVSAADENSGADASDKATVWVVGDSTVSGFEDKYYYPRYGWGTQLDNYLDDTLQVNNLALSGRSSKSFTTEDNYQTLLTGMKSGDYLLIGFGHNDEKAEKDRYTNPNGDYKAAGSFANSLYENYIKPAQAAGTTVIICTPIVRRTASDGGWKNSELHITETSGEYEGGDYAQAIRKLGTDLNIPVVDMTAMTKELYDTLGAGETLYLHAWTSSKEGSVDNTHTNIWGGKYNAYLITQKIKELKVAGIADHIITAEAPTKSEALVSNPDYVEHDYTPVTGESTLYSKAGIWSATAFGDLGGNPTTDKHIFGGQDENGNIHMAVTGNKGKIANTTDGIIMYYYKVPAGRDFTLTANVTVNSYDINNQVSFGLMARDDMYLDYYTKDTLGDYVTAGPLKLATAGGVWNCFARKGGVLTQGGTCVNEIKAGDTYALKIQSNSDGYACTFGKEETITGGFDFKLTSIDSEYVYVGMYVARNADVTFSDVNLVIAEDEDNGSTGDGDENTEDGGNTGNGSTNGGEDGGNTGNGTTDGGGNTGDGTTNGGNNGNQGAATGDAVNAAPIAVMMMLSAMVMAVVCFYERKRRSFIGR